MRSIFTRVIFALESLILFSNSQHLPEPILNAKKMDLQTQRNSIAPRSTLMLGCTCRIHLGIQWPRIRCSRAYDQHQHGRIHGLFPTLPTYLFICSRGSCSTKMSQNTCTPKLLAQYKYKYSCAPELLTQHKTPNTHVLQRFLLNTNISSIMCFRVHAQHVKSYI